MSGDFLVVTLVGEEGVGRMLLVASSGWKPGMWLNILQYAGQFYNRELIEPEYPSCQD